MVQVPFVDDCPAVRWTYAGRLRVYSGVGRDGGNALRAGTFPLSPYVMRDKNQLTRFSIDLWKAVAKTMKVKID